MGKKSSLILIISFVLLFGLMPYANGICWSGLFGGECCDNVGNDCCTSPLRCDEGLVCDTNTNKCKSGSSSSGGPTQCAIIAAGCYKKDSSATQTANSIKPAEFEYYMPSAKCTGSASGGSTSTGSTTDSVGTTSPPEPPPEIQAAAIKDITGRDIDCGDGRCNTDLGECDSCPSDCSVAQCQQTLCGNGNLDPLEQCGEPGLSCPSPQTCNSCSCSTPQAPGCSCPAGSSQSVEEIKDADASKEACGCILGSSYLEPVIPESCCGNEQDDCGWRTSDKKSICSMPLTGLSETIKSEWKTASADGQIIYVPCKQLMYISLGQKWIKCEGGEFEGVTTTRKNKLTIGTHDYICQGNAQTGFGKKSIAMCCGTAGCGSVIDEVEQVLVNANSNPPIPPLNPSKFESKETKTTFAITGYAVGEPESQCGLPGSSCDAPSGSPIYKRDVETAMNKLLDENAELANKPNNDEEAVDAYLAGVANELRGMGYEAGRAINCNGNEGQDSIMVGRPADKYAEYYDIIVGHGNGALLKNSKGIGYFQKASWARFIPSSYIGFGTNVNYYCNADGKFTTSLDSGGTHTGGGYINPDRNKDACLSSGYFWTGTKCCGEPGSCEYYNDPGKTAGCWKSKHVLSITYVEETQKSVINYDGSFYGCAIAKNNYNNDNNIYLGLLDKGTAKQLITDKEYCANDPKKLYFCSYKEEWTLTNGKNRTKLSTAPTAAPAQKSECCDVFECWDGDKCIADQSNSPTAQPLNSKRCIKGEWTNSILKYTPDESASGYCSEESQCLLNPNAPVGKQCISSTEYSSDNYCDDGIWSTRTKLIALKLLGMKSGSYTLFCDNRENSLNNLQYLTDSNVIVADILQGLGTNNFCVMKNGDKIIAGVSINRGIENATAGSINIFKVTGCSQGLIDDGQYHPCDSSNKVWYNKKYKSFIYGQSAINIPSDSGPTSKFQEFIGNPVVFIVNKIKSLVNPAPTADTYYVDKLKRFDRLYMSEQQGKTIRGVLEGNQMKNLIIGYSGFSNDLCSFVNNYNTANKDTSSGISCVKEGTNYYVLGQGTQATNVNPNLIWTDMTSKLRIT